MKKKILLMTAMIVVLICIFTVSISAAEPSYKDGEWIYAEDGTTKLAIRDTDGNPLIWYMNGEELKYVRADQTDTTQSVYVVYKIEAGGNGLSDDVSSNACLKDIDIYDNGTRIECATYYSELVLINMERLNVDAFNSGLFGSRFGCCPKMRGFVFPSTLKQIGQQGFTKTNLVQVWNFENTQLEYLADYTAFAATSTLTQEVTGGVFKVPNSYTKQINVQNSKIKVYISSANATEGNSNQTLRGCNSLEFVYMPGATASTGFRAECFRDSSARFVFFMVGTEQNCEDFISNTESNYNSFFKNNTVIISTEEYFANKSTYDDATDKIYMVYGYNACDAFYDGNHLEDNNSCVINCSQCNTYGVAEKNPVHKEASKMVYTSYDKEGSLIITCENDNCKYAAAENLPALFTCLGYSAPEDGRGGIAIGFTVNNVAIAEYKEATGKTLKYGVFAVLQDRLGDNDVFAEDGTVAEGAINADITSYEFALFELKIVGFTDEYKDIKLAMGAYVAVTDGESTEYSYMQGGEPNENEKYCFVSYNDIVNAPSTDEEVTQ